MNERLSWQEIVKRFPDQWVRLEEVETEPDNDATIVSAIVTKAGDLNGQDDVDAYEGKCWTTFVDGGNFFYIGLDAI